MNGHHKNRLLVVISMALFSISPLGLAQQSNPSIMFQKSDENLDYLVTQPNAQNDQSSECVEMARQIESLRGKPQRRNIAIKRYELECKGGSIDYERYDNEGLSR